MLTEEKQAQALKFERDIAVAPNEVYRAFTHRAMLRDWLCNTAEAEARIGGRIYLWWDSGYYSSGVFTDLERNKAVSFTWRGPNDPEATDVHVTLTPHGDGGTHVELTHSGLGPGDEWSEIALRDEGGWESALENLQSALEKGVDLRVTRRPLLGLNGWSDLNDDLIARLSLPVEEGFWIGGLIDGLGAQKAGLQRDDVVVSMDGHPITGFATFGNAMQNYRAGDQVEVSFYRDGELRHLTMPLSARPNPAVPATHGALVETLRATYAEVDADLDAALEGVTEQEAEYRIAPDEWNAKEILAHLITSEQGTQSSMYATVDDTDIFAPFFSNEPTRIRAVATTYGTIAALVEALKRAEAITLAQLAAMPAQAQARKHMYILLAQGFMGFHTHNHDHIAEIKARVEAARAHANAE